jgi:murein DD-endopeptidase MepM/ murein hydrolase activator NlpD
MGVPAMSNADFALLQTIAAGGSPSPGEMLASMAAPGAAPSPLSAPLPIPTSPRGLTAPVGGGDKYERVDQGVDFMSTHPVKALAGGTVVSVTKGMAGGTGDIIKIKLDHPVSVNGRTYDQIYYSEERPLVRQGQRVTAGQAVMAAGGNELGFLDSRGQMAPLVGGLGAGTQPTQMGSDFLHLLRQLGVHA